MSLGGRGSSPFLPSADTSVGGGAVYALSTAPSPWELGNEATGRPVTAPGQHNEGEIKEGKKETKPKINKKENLQQIHNIKTRM